MRAVFFDRDGVLNRVVPREGRPGSPRTPQEFEVEEAAPAAVARLRGAGYRVFVITNQPDLARGLLTEAALAAMTARLRAALAVDEVAVCPHDDADGCRCRKPAPGMIQELAARWGIDLGASVVVGDTWRDMEAGRAAGCRTVLLRRSYNEGAGGDVEAGGLLEAADLILRGEVAHG